MISMQGVTQTTAEEVMGQTRPQSHSMIVIKMTLPCSYMQLALPSIHTDIHTNLLTNITTDITTHIAQHT
jgi:hypothetical protein